MMEKSFLPLASDIFVYEPSPRNVIAEGKRAASASKLDPPSTIVVFAWMGANPRHVAKYTSQYSKLYPSAQILMITTSWADFLYRPQNTQQKRLSPVVKLLQANPNGALLVHVASNGGSKQLNNLTAAYRKETGQLLPVKALVLDSAPGRATFWASVAVFAETLNQPAYLQSLVYVFSLMLVATFWLLRHITGTRDVVEQVRQDLNDPRLMPLDMRRCYIYSVADQCVAWRDVEEHAAEAHRKGWCVMLEKFLGSGHVDHMRLDGASYWKAVEQLWEQSQSGCEAASY